MRKILAAFGYLFIFLIVAQLVATYYVSGVVEEKFRKMELFLNETQVISSEIVSYDKGLFKSEVVTNIKFKLLHSVKLCQIKHTILHGPVIVTGDQKSPIELQLAIINSYPVEMLSSVNMPFTARTVLNYQGKVESVVEGKAFDIQRNQFKVTGSDWKSSIHITPDWLSFKGHIIFPETIVHSMGMALIIKDLGLNFDQNRSIFGNWLGDVSFTLGGISQKEKSLDISNFQFKEKSVLQGEAINVVWGVDLEKVGIADVVYGPLHVKILADNVDAKALQELSQTQKGNLTTEKQEDNFREFLLRRPKIMVDQSYLTLPQGSIRVDGELSLGGPDVTVPLKKEALEQTMDGKVSIVMPKEIFKQILASELQKEIAKQPDYEKMDDQKRKEELGKQIDLKIQKLTQDGVLTEKEKDYEINITIVKGKWTSSSGKELSSPPLS